MLLAIVINFSSGKKIQFYFYYNLILQKQIHLLVSLALSLTDVYHMNMQVAAFIRNVF